METQSCQGNLLQPKKQPLASTKKQKAQVKGQEEEKDQYPYQNTLC
jgi:hypothetical protein